MEEIPNKVRAVLGILADVNLHTTAQGDIIEIIVEGYPYPVNYKGQYHYRSGSTKQELKGTALDKFLLQKKGKRWDGVPVPKVSVKDLKQDSFEFFSQKSFQKPKNTFGFAGHTSQPFTKPKELKFPNASLKMCKTFCGLFMSI